MANNLTSNTSKKVLRVFLEQMMSNVVVTKTVDTQLIESKITPQTGATISVKRPHDFKSDRTSDGDISALPASDIIAGKADGVVQDYITVRADFSVLDESTSLDQLNDILAPAAARMVSDLETSYAGFMAKNCNLHYGTPGTPITKWSDVAGAAALMQSVGIPSDGNWNYVLNPFNAAALADAQRGLSSGSKALVDTAWSRAQLTSSVAGLKAMTSNALQSYTAGTLVDRAGVLSATPNATYVAHKDTMIQSVAVSGFGAGADTIKAGEIVVVTTAGRSRLSLATRKSFVDNTGAPIAWSGVVTQDVTLVAGAGTLLVAGPAINEATGAYNTVSSPIVAGDVITVLGLPGVTYQPNLFYHKQAFGIGFVKIPKLFSTDTRAVTKEGISVRVSSFSDGLKNTQTVRFDMQPVFAVFDPFKAGQGFGV